MRLSRFYLPHRDPEKERKGDGQTSTEELGARPWHVRVHHLTFQICIFRLIKSTSLNNSNGKMAAVTITRDPHVDSYLFFFFFWQSLAHSTLTGMGTGTMTIPDNTRGSRRVAATMRTAATHQERIQHPTQLCDKDENRHHHHTNTRGTVRRQWRRQLLVTPLPRWDRKSVV